MKPTSRRPTPALFVVLCLVLLAASTGPAATRSEVGYPRVMQGPMVGAVTPSSVRIWARLTGEYSLTVEYGTDPELATFTTSEPVTAAKATDLTVVATLEELQPATEYFYRVRVNGDPDRYLRGFPPFRFETAPPVGSPAGFRVAFGSCPRYQEDRVQPIWAVVERLEPELFFWIGDNIYGDTLDPDILRECYRRQRDVAPLQPVLHTVSNLAVWDDHDYGQNNQDRTNSIKAEAFEVFREYWPNPSYGLADAPGVFFAYRYGQVDFFFLDDRTWRDPDEDPDTAEKTLLGAEQLAWLKRGLEASTAVFKVIVSGSGFNSGKGPGGDSWAAFLNERNHLFDFIRDREITGVVLLSGDTHVGEINVIPWSEHGGYDLYDLVSSPLAQRPPDSWLERRPERRIRPVYFQGSNVGVVDFLFDPEPRLTYRLFDVHGRSIWKTFEVRASELVNGVRSWPDKVDEGERRRQEHYDRGEGYYEVPVD